MYKTKLNPNGLISKHKARLMVIGFLQKHGINYNEVFAHMERVENVILVVEIASSRVWSLHHMDVKFAFLNGPLEEVVYVTQSLVFVIKGYEHMIYKLHKTLYALKQALRAWNKRIDQFLVNLGFKKCNMENDVYVRESKEEGIMINFLYIDDLLITCNHSCTLEKLKTQMNEDFEMIELGRLSCFLDMKFVNRKEGMGMHQQKYEKELLEIFKMTKCKVITNPSETNTELDEYASEEVDATFYKEMVGSLITS